MKINYLISKGYNGDIYVKLYKSAKYYYKKKNKNKSVKKEKNIFLLIINY